MEILLPSTAIGHRLVFVLCFCRCLASFYSQLSSLQSYFASLPSHLCPLLVYLNLILVILSLFTVVCHLSQTFSFFDSHSASVCSHFTSCLDHFVLLFLCCDWTDILPSRWYVTTMLCELVDRRKRVIVLTLLDETRSSCASVSSGSSFPSNALTCLSNTGTVNTYTPAGFESWTLFPQIRPTAVLSFCVKWKIMQK